MNKRVKVLVVVATAMIAAGVIFSAVGFALGGFRSVHFGSGGFYVEEGAPAPWDERESLSERPGDFSGINIDLGAHELSLREGEIYGVKARGLRARDALEIRVDDGVLTLRDNDARAEQRGVFVSLFPSPFLIFGGGDTGDGATIEITYPAGARFDDVSIAADAGDVEIADLDAHSLSVFCSVGSLKIEESAADELHVNLDVGSCEIKDMRAGEAVAELDVGSFSARGFDCDSLRGSFRVGGADVDGRLGDVDISADISGVSLHTDLPKSEYRVNLDVSLGKATIDGDSFSGGNFSYGAGSAPYSIRIRASMGSVEVDFS
jgi:hypothetical protein